MFETRFSARRFDSNDTFRLKRNISSRRAYHFISVPNNFFVLNSDVAQYLSGSLAENRLRDGGRFISATRLASKAWIKSLPARPCVRWRGHIETAAWGIPWFMHSPTLEASARIRRISTQNGNCQNLFTVSVSLIAPISISSPAVPL